MHESIQSSSSAYDSVPYAEIAHSATHPRHLEALATLFEMQPRDITQCRVLELGCASGTNLIPQAAELAGSTFVGVDLSQRQVETAQATIRALGLKNIEMRQANILDIDASWGKFDYIISHGLFSWMPAAARDKLLAISSENLNEQGVAYVSYNTYPGWHIAAVAREAMRFHTARMETPQQKMVQAMAFLRFLKKAVPASIGIHKAVEEELAAIESVASDAYLYHEHLEEYNHPMYFHEFIDLAKSHGLQYLADAEFYMMLVQNLPEVARKQLEGLPSLYQEQYIDFVLGRRFRRTMLCHEGIRVNRCVKPERVLAFQYALMSPVEAKGVDIRTDAPALFQRKNMSLTTKNRMVKAAVMYLQEVFPRFVAFDELHRVALARIGRVSTSDAIDDQPLTLAAQLLLAFSVNLLDICLHSPQCVTKPSDRPVASRLARLQAEHDGKVTTQRHHMVSLNPVERRVMRRLDGSHRREDLRQCVEEAIQAGEVTLRRDGQEQVARAAEPKMITQLLEQALARISSSGLLIG
jgi:methyltransferase-like protein/SAM-dependent methyltransferase